MTMLTGPRKGNRYSFHGRHLCVIGRSRDCTIQFASHPSDLGISHHHCQLCIDPPSVALQDLGSLNGTYLNGRRLASEGAPAEDSPSGRNPSVPTEVEDGDIITVGANSFRVEIVCCRPGLRAGDGAAPFWSKREAIRANCPVNC
jgi:pSer/pThr/pTyr-binding forkhead associated (FHA) protein